MGKRRRQNKIASKFYYFFFVYTIKLDELYGADQIRPMSMRIRLKQRKNRKTQETTRVVVVEEEDALNVLFFWEDPLINWRKILIRKKSQTLMKKMRFLKA